MVTWPVAQVTADQTKRLPQMIGRRPNRSARYPPTGLRNAYTHLNWPSIRPQFASVTMVGMSPITENFMAASIWRSR